MEIPSIMAIAGNALWIAADCRMHSAKPVSGMLFCLLIVYREIKSGLELALGQFQSRKF